MTTVTDFGNNTLHETKKGSNIVIEIMRNYNMVVHIIDFLYVILLEPVTVEELEAETEQLRSVVTCLMCEENDANCLYLPCAHHRLCIQCSANITECPICLRQIHSKVKTFMS